MLKDLFTTFPHHYFAISGQGLIILVVLWKSFCSILNFKIYPLIPLVIVNLLHLFHGLLEEGLAVHRVIL